MDGVERIAAERKRQIEKEGWTPGHDDGHTDDSIVLAAICYAAFPIPLYRLETTGPSLIFMDPWPRSWLGWDKRDHSYAWNGVKMTDRQRKIRNLEKAGALIAAEIDRLLRLEK